MRGTQAFRRRLSFDKFAQILEAPNTEPISSIKQRVNASRQAVKRVLAFSGTRTPEQIIQTGIKANAKSLRLESILEPQTTEWVRRKLRGKTMTLEQIARKSGISLTGIKHMNARQKERKKN